MNSVILLWGVAFKDLVIRNPKLLILGKGEGERGDSILAGNFSRYKWILLGIFIAVFYWLLESVVDAFIFFEAGFLTEVFDPGLHEIWMRSVMVIVIVGFAAYAQYSINRVRESEERIEDLYSLLLSVRNINQLIVQESDLEELFQKSADTLLQTRGYIDTYIAVLRNSEIVPIAHSGDHRRDRWSITPDGEGEAPRCVRETLEIKSGKVIRSTKEYCEECEFCDHGPDHKTILMPLLRENSMVGFLSACLEKDREAGEEEIDLLEEISNDLAYAREKILEERRRRESERRRMFLNAILRQDLMSKSQMATGYLQLLEEDISEEGKDYLRNALENTKSAVDMIEEVKKLREVEQMEDVGRTNIIKILDKVIEGDEGPLERGDCEIVTDYEGGVLNVVGNYSLEDLFRNLILARVGDQKCSKIRISLEENEEEILIKMEDDGQVLPDQIKRNVSNGIYTGRTAGVGGFRYYIVRELVEVNRGSMEVKDSELGGARFDIRLQRA